MTSSSVGTDAFPLTERVVANGDVTLRVIEQGSGPAVLFCHGFPETADTWRSQMLAVARAGYRAVALDMRGHGASSAPVDPALYTSLHTVGDLIAVLDTLDIEAAVIVGHDWGADHAQRAAVMRPDRVRAIVSMSIPFAPRGEMSHWDALRAEGLGDRYYALDMLRDDADSDFPPTADTVASILYWLSASPDPGEGWDPIDARRSMLRPAPDPAPAWIDPEYLDRLVGAIGRSGFRGGLNHYRAVQASFDLTAAFRNVVITQPSLYIWGADDGLSRFFHPETPTLSELRHAQPGLVDQIRLEGVGHWIHQEAPSRLNEAILGFLEHLDWSEERWW
ncbi:alpha/beta fold hydrolase [Labedella endophytica]|uniref:Alpha/beta hydrolase n=1 Tax=Labedella endophytica TaxID=1523160 RepID=A0A433JPN3_9MICO|nr:alpha/beta hydrolase [Labedella endophytica]RUQ98156.1 alpha/beta hydrolase [Labedella endophytica]